MVAGPVALQLCVALRLGVDWWACGQKLIELRILNNRSHEFIFVEEESVLWVCEVLADKLFSLRVRIWVLPGLLVVLFKCVKQLNAVLLLQLFLVVNRKVQLQICYSLILIPKWSPYRLVPRLAGLIVFWIYWPWFLLGLLY